MRWQRRSGRHHLPWQHTREPYHVWLSEIMLQQTQAARVQLYWPRFLARFPTLQSLAAAPLDDVLALWSGLGYYRRAALLHRCAQLVATQHGGEFPRSASELETLPGIGRSTAAAIAAFCWGERTSILDGNVRRLLARFFTLDAPTERQLWPLAQSLLPANACDMPAYTQALMDLGALICTPRRPDCQSCPLAAQCRAAASGQPERWPAPTPRPQKRSLTLWLLHACDADDSLVWLAQRPARGIWGGLHCLPTFPSRARLLAALPADARAAAREQPPIRHQLTHRNLTLRIIRAPFAAGSTPPAPGAWHNTAALHTLGLPAPISRYMGIKKNIPSPPPRTARTGGEGAG